MAHVKDIAITKDKIYQGVCHCRGVRFCLTGPLRQALICHCRGCFQIAGLGWGSTSVPDASFELTAQQTLGWYDSLGLGQTRALPKLRCALVLSPKWHLPNTSCHWHA